MAARIASNRPHAIREIPHEARGIGPLAPTLGSP
jgi:hypothetical protein